MNTLFLPLPGILHQPHALSDLDSLHNSNILEIITISPSDIYDAVTSLDPNKAQGIDHISLEKKKKVLQSYTTFSTTFLLSV